MEKGGSSGAGPFNRSSEIAISAIDAFHSALWIWYREGNPAVDAPPGKRYFRKIVNVDARSPIESARLRR